MPSTEPRSRDDERSQSGAEAAVLLPAVRAGRFHAAGAGGTREARRGEAATAGTLAVGHAAARCDPRGGGRHRGRAASGPLRRRSGHRPRRRHGLARPHVQPPRRPQRAGRPGRADANRRHLGGPGLIPAHLDRQRGNVARWVVPGRELHGRQSGRAGGSVRPRSGPRLVDRPPGRRWVPGAQSHARRPAVRHRSNCRWRQVLAVGAGVGRLRVPDGDDLVRGRQQGLHHVRGSGEHSRGAHHSRNHDQRRGHDSADRRRRRELVDGGQRHGPRLAVHGQ